MTGKNALILALSTLLMASFTISGCQIFSPGKFRITEIKMAPIISKNFTPIKPTDSFPKGTSRVFCWFKWENAQVNSQILTKWYYKNTNILNYPLSIPRRDGSGSVLLSMPKGKTLPSGPYKINLVVNNHILKSRGFKIE